MKEDKEGGREAKIYKATKSSKHHTKFFTHITSCNLHHSQIRLELL